MPTTSHHVHARAVSPRERSPTLATAARSAGSDADLFRASYARHRDAVWRFLARRLGDGDLAEDLTSEVFVVAWRRRAEAPAAELPWLYAVARRVLANDRRAMRRRVALDASLASELAVAPETATHDPGALAGSACLRALAALAAADREVVILAAWEGLSGRELAIALDCRPNTARVRLHRARRRLQSLLDDHTSEGPSS